MYKRLTSTKGEQGVMFSSVLTVTADRAVST